MAIGKLAADDDGEGEAIFAEINITPLTDVFLVMVVIFMLTSLAMRADNQKKQQQKEKETQDLIAKQDADTKRGMKVNLPQGQAQEIDPTKTSLVLDIPLSGEVNILGKTITDDKLDNIFLAAFQHDKNTQVVLKADKGVSHGRVVNLMERAKKAGLVHLAIGTSG